MNRLQHTAITAFMAAILIVSTLILFGLFWMYNLDDRVPVELDSPLQVDKAEYYPGEPMVITAYNLCRYSEAPITIYSSYRDTFIYNLPPVEAAGVPAGCFESRSATLTIPEALPPGTYVFFTRLVYHVNPLADRVAETVTEPFTVLPLPED